MPRFTSGFTFKEDGSYLFLVNSQYYNLEDDVACFELSCMYNKMKNVKIENNYEILKADIKDRYGNGWSVWIDFNENGKEEFRVYKVIEN
jgi:hypothetical protein